jgi:hypothetical protein
MDTATCVSGEGDSGTDVVVDAGTPSSSEETPSIDVSSSSLSSDTEKRDPSDSGHTGSNGVPADTVGFDAGDTSMTQGMDAGLGQATSTHTNDATGAESVETQSGAVDAAVDGGMGSGAVVRCDPSKPFGRPFALQTINLDDVPENLMVSPDGLTAYIRYGTDPTTYVSRRASAADDFGTPQPDSTFDQVLAANPLLQLRAITKDGLTAYLSEEWFNAQPIQSVRRSVLGAEFIEPIVHEELAVAEDIYLGNPWVAPSGERVYGMLLAAYSLWSADLQSPGFETPAEVPNVSNLTHFTLSGSELVIYWGATAATNPGIRRAERATLADDFSDPIALDTLNSAFHDLPIWVSDDDCELIFAHEGELQGEGTGYTSDLFIARRGL